MRIAGALSCWLFVTAAATVAPAVQAPRLGVANLSDLVVPDRPYDRRADADAAVAAAFARARSFHKRVLIDLGGNWCADCRILSGVMQLPQMQRFLKAHYEVVLVDVGRFDTNLQVPARFGITQRLEGVPAVLIVDPDGTLLNRDWVEGIDGAASMTPQAIADWLAQWAK